MAGTDSKVPNGPLVHGEPVGAPTLLLAGPALELVEPWTAELMCFGAIP